MNQSELRKWWDNLVSSCVDYYCMMLFNILIGENRFFMVRQLNEAYEDELVRPMILNPLLQLWWLILDHDLPLKYYMRLDYIGDGIMNVFEMFWLHELWNDG